MPRPVRAILIDPYAGTVTEVEHDADDYAHIYKLLSGEPHDVECFTAVHLEDGDAIFVDDNGFLSSDERRRPFKWVDFPQTLVGRGLILGSDEQGTTQACKLTLEQARERVQFAPVCFEPKRPADDDMVNGVSRRELRTMIATMATDGSDEDFDKLGLRIAMGSTVADLMGALHSGEDLAKAFGKSAEGVKAMAQLECGERHYHLALEACPGCDAAASEKEGE